jgi:cytochrome c556
MKTWTRQDLLAKIANPQDVAEQKALLAALAQLDAMPARLSDADRAEAEGRASLEAKARERAEVEAHTAWLIDRARSLHGPVRHRPQPKPDPRGAEEGEPDKECPSCHEMNDDDATECEKCGEPLPASDEPEAKSTTAARAFLASWRGDPAPPARMLRPAGRR